MLQQTEIEKSCTNCIHCDSKYDPYEYDTTHLCIFEESKEEIEVNPVIANEYPNYEEYPTNNTNP